MRSWNRTGWSSEPGRLQWQRGYIVQESIHKYFQVGLVAAMADPAAWKGKEETFLAGIRQVVTDDYFDVIEVNPIKPERREQVKKWVTAGHLKLCYSGHARLLGAGLNPNALEEAERQKAEDALKEGLEEAKELGADTLAFLSGHWEEKTREEAYRQLVKTTGNLCAYAQERQMKIEIEVFDYDIAKKSLLGPAPLAARFAAELRSKFNNFGLMIDLSHIPMTHETGRFVVQTLRPYLTHFHIGNTVIKSPAAPAYGDEHPRFGFPGSCADTPEVLEFLRVLKQEGFFCPEKPFVLSFEIKPWADEDPALVLANAKRVLNRAWALLE